MPEYLLSSFSFSVPYENRIMRSLKDVDCIFLRIFFREMLIGQKLSLLEFYDLLGWAWMATSRKGTF